MKTFPRLTILLLALVFALASVAPALAAKTFRLGTTVNEQDSFQVAAVKFADLVKERTKGEYLIEIYPNAALGDERTMIEGMQMGTLDFGVLTSAPFVNFVPDFGMIDLPYLFPPNDQVYKVLDGPIGKELLAKLDGANLKGLAYAERGFRNVTNSKRPIVKAADIKGLKIRVMENRVYLAAFRALGANAVPMAFTELLTALQQGTIDGQENPINIIHASKLSDSQKYLTLTRHTYAPAIVTASKQLFDKFPADIQKIMMDSAQEAAVHARAWIAANEARQLAELKKAGMEVVENPDLESFRAAVAKVYDEFPQYAEGVKRIRQQLAQ